MIDGQLIPVFLEYRYNVYLKRFSPYFYADGGALLDLIDLKKGSRIFINPGDWSQPACFFQI